MQQQNPALYQKAMEMTSGKSEAQMKETCFNLAKERGIDLQKFAGTFGIKI